MRLTYATKLIEMTTALEAKDSNLQATKTALEATRTAFEKQGAVLEATTTALGKRSLGSVREYYPAVVDRTLSGPHNPKNHAGADVISDPVDDNVLSSLDEVMDDDFFKASFVSDYSDESESEPSTCDSESMAQGKVVSLVKAVLKGMKLFPKIIEVVENRSLAGVECDILLVHRPSRLPFAVIEVKKPGNLPEQIQLIFEGGNAKENLVAGQVFDQMMAIKLFGFKECYGMISTFNQWRLVCSSKSGSVKGSAQETLKHFIGKHQHQDEVERDQVSPPRGPIKFTDESHTQGLERQIFASQIVPQLTSNGSEALPIVTSSGHVIVKLITLFVIKACGAFLGRDSRNPMSGHPKMPGRILADNSDVFAFGTAD
jgi:hypothetical protein